MPNLKQKRYYPPTAEDFYLVRRVACLNQKNVAELLHVNLRTVKNWELGKTTIPYASYKLLRVLTRYELPTHEWQNWTVRGAHLFAPNGRSFQAHELYYISNYFQMARFWISERQEINKAKRVPVEFPPLRLIQGGIA